MRITWSSSTLRASRPRTLIPMIVAALLSAVALTGCKTIPDERYKAGYDKALTADSWATRTPDQAVVIIGGYPSVWQKADEASYAFEARPRYKVGLFGWYDVALVKAGTYQLETIVGADGTFADFSGFNQGRVGTAPVTAIASFEVGAGQVIYLGDLNALVRVEDYASCVAVLSVSSSAPHVLPLFAKQFPYVKVVPKTGLLTVEQDGVPFPCGMDG